VVSCAWASERKAKISTTAMKARPRISQLHKFHNHKDIHGA
jgi:hypothetical protein